MNSKEMEQTNKEVARTIQFDPRKAEGASEDNSKIYAALREQFLAIFQRPLPIDEIVDRLELA